MILYFLSFREIKFYASSILNCSMILPFFFGMGVRGEILTIITRQRFA